LADSSIGDSCSLDEGNGMKRFRQKQLLALSAGALLVVALSLASRIAGRIGVTDPRVRVEMQTMAAAAGDARQQRYQVVERAMTGEVATTAERLQEATMLATAASLLIATELANRRAPANADALISALMKRGLLPGEFSMGQPGTLATARGTLALRYRGAPIGVEVISLGKGRESGQAILVRAPEDERSNESGVWLAESLNEAVIPRPFAPAAELIASGWQPDAVPNVR
jgi:hypothetical protein